MFCTELQETDNITETILVETRSKYPKIILFNRGQIWGLKK